MEMKGKLRQLGQNQDKDCSTSTHIWENKKIQKSSAIVESLPTNKKMISKDKLHTCNNTSQKQKSSKILEVGSTLKEKDLTPYWNDYCKEISSGLWLPTRTDLLDLDSNLSSSWSSKTVEKSWFSTKLISLPTKSSQMTFSTLSMFSHVGCMVSGNTVNKSKKIRIYPTSFQKELLKECLGVYRFVYNRTIDYLKQEGTKANWKGIKTETLHGLPEFCKDIPYQIKSIAIRDACISVREAKKKCLTNGIFNEVKFKSRKNPKQSFYVPKSAVTGNGFYKTIFGEMLYKEQLPENIKDCRLSFYLDKWYLCVPFESKLNITESQGRLVSLDPGVRTFQTFFSQDSCGKLGTGDFSRIQRLCCYLDKLISKRELARAKRKNSIKKAINRLRFKIRNLVDELHHKIANFLVTNFDVILLPTFESKDMSMKATRKIRKKSVRSLLTWSHYRFKQFLKSKAYEYGKVVLDVNEAYTSKTVSWTGEIIENLGGRKWIKSPLTGKVMDRDYNGARGIFLRALVDSPTLRSAIINVS